jgi:hypothetical protein
MKNPEKRPIHLLIRFSDNLFAVGDAIAKHQEVIKQNSSVWFGKLGTPISQNAIESFISQIEKGIPTYLYLVKGNRKRSTFYKAKILTLSGDFPKKEKDNIPYYYFEKKIAKQMKSWVKIIDIQPLEAEEIKSLRVKSSVLDIEETLFRSSAGLFYVVVRNKNEIGISA